MYWPHAIVELGIVWFLFYLTILYKIQLYFKNHRSRINTTLFLLLSVIIFTSFLSMSMESPSISVCIFLFSGLYYNKKS